MTRPSHPPRLDYSNYTWPILILSPLKTKTSELHCHRLGERREELGSINRNVWAIFHWIAELVATRSFGRWLSRRRERREERREEIKG
jgi:hypothetical protein